MSSLRLFVGLVVSIRWRLTLIMLMRHECDVPGKE